MVTDTTEKGLEALITNSLISSGWLPGSPENYDRAHCVDLSHLTTFLEATQPETATSLSLHADTPTRRQFLNRLKREISNRGIIDILRKGIKHGPNDLTLFYGTPTPGNTAAEQRYQLKPVLRHPPTAVQLQQPEPPGLGAVHQRPAGGHHGVEEPVHWARRGQRRRTIPDLPQPPGGPLPARPLRRPPGRGRRGGGILHPAKGQTV